MIKRNALITFQNFINYTDELKETDAIYGTNTNLSYYGLKKLLREVLTAEEIELFNDMKYYKIVPICEMLEIYGQTGVLNLSSTVEHTVFLINEFGYTESDVDFYFDELRVYYKKRFNEFLDNVIVYME